MKIDAKGIGLIISIAALLVALGVFAYATDFTAYMGSNPTTCNNCHVMDSAYESWYHGGHAKVAVCGDCHVPHDFIPKYAIKAYSGYRHVSAFMLGHIPDAIRAKQYSKDIIQENCIRCHEETVSTMLENIADFDRQCYDCHRDVAHGERGISILPYQHQEKNK
jgi:cytochrome c nitrite reductase small subunit